MVKKCLEIDMECAINKLRSGSGVADKLGAKFFLLYNTYCI
jgi:hypothetical protein